MLSFGSSLNVMWIGIYLLGEHTTYHVTAGKDYAKAKGTRAHKITIESL